MIKRIYLAAPAALALATAAPIAAQDEVETVEMSEEAEDMGEIDPMAAMMGIFGDLFKVDPLTAEQEARLPMAESIALKIMPDGVLAEVMQSLIGGFMDPIMEMAPSPAQSVAGKGLGVSGFELGLTEEEMAEVASMLDPSWEERREREMAVLPELMTEVANTMEPGMRKAVAEIYAVNFEASELTELDTFFSTEVGSKFARESYKMAADPRIMSASFESVPQLLGKVGDMKKMVDEATADLPEARAFADLSSAQKSRITELTGFTADDIQANLDEAAEMETWLEEGDAEEGDEAAE